MGAGRKTKTITVHENIPWNPENGSLSARNLCVRDLRGVIFGCTHDTMAECLSKQLFGLPYLHSYVKNIGVGLPLFLFNYSDRKLHGIYEAASGGQMYLNVSAWTCGESDKTPFPAQVRVRTRVQCQPLVEKEFKKIIEKNYYMPRHFWFELDEAQTRGLIALFKPAYPSANRKLAPVTSTVKELFPTLSPTKTIASNNKGFPPPLPATAWKDVVSQNMKNLNPSGNKFASLRDDGDCENDNATKALSMDPGDMESKESVSDWEELAVDNVQNISSGSCSGSSSLFGGANCISENRQYANKTVEREDSNLAAGHAHLDLSSGGCIHGVGVDCAPGEMYQDGGFVVGDFSMLPKKDGSLLASYLNHGSAQDVEGSCASFADGNTGHVECINASNHNHDNVELVQFIKEFKEWAVDLKNHQIQSECEIQQLRNQLSYSDRKIRLLEDRVKELEFKVDPSKLVDESLDKFVEQHMGSEDVIYLIGGFDGISWLSALDCFSPSLDMITSLKSMNSARSYASSVALGGNLFVFGGRIGKSWFDTVEYYNRRDDEWISCPPMLRKKGSLCGATLNGKIFAIGGGDDIECLSEVETFDPAIGKWTTNQPMHHKRFASAATELKGAIYALGGYDGHQYLRSAEKFDPREGCWTEIPSMNTRRGSHALAVFNENLYCIGGYDGQKLVFSVENFDTRMTSWVMCEPMKSARGYAAAAVLGNSLFAIGGIGDDDSIVEIVECYKEGIGWSDCGWKAIGKRSFCSAIVV